MLIALIELRNDPPFCEFGGLVETPPEITHDEMPGFYAEWFSELQADNTRDEFCEWLCKNHGCKEVACGFAMLDAAKLEEDEE